MGAVFALICAWYFWIPKILGVNYKSILGNLHFLIFFFGVNVTFFPQHFLGLQGMPRRISDYPDAFGGWNLVSSLGSLMGVLATWLFLYLLYAQLVQGKVISWLPLLAPEHHTDTLQAYLIRGFDSLEWSLDSPPKPHAFASLPLQSGYSFKNVFFILSFAVFTFYFRMFALWLIDEYWADFLTYIVTSLGLFNFSSIQDFFYKLNPFSFLYKMRYRIKKLPPLSEMRSIIIDLASRFKDGNKMGMGPTNIDTPSSSSSDNIKKSLNSTYLQMNAQGIGESSSQGAQGGGVVQNQSNSQATQSADGEGYEFDPYHREMRLYPRRDQDWRSGVTLEKLHQKYCRDRGYDIEPDGTVSICSYSMGNRLLNSIGRYPTDRQIRDVGIHFSNFLEDHYKVSRANGLPPHAKARIPFHKLDQEQQSILRNIIATETNNTEIFRHNSPELRSKLRNIRP